MKLIGVTRIGNDPVVRYTPDGGAVLDLSLAYNHGKKQDDGKRPTQWVNAVLWGPRAEKMGPYLTKGKEVFVDCSDVFVEVYQKKDGGQGFSLKARVDTIEFVGGSKSEPEAKVAAPAKSAAKQDHFAGLDDDIPFN